MKIAIPQRNNGVALIIVLSILAILMALVLAFFALVQTERQSSSLFSESVEVRILAEIPVNLAIGQIRKATENNGPTLPTMPSVVAETQFKSWASQPGMIRVFGLENDGSNVRSKATALYKLYSDDKMVEIKPGATSLSSGLSKAEVVAALKADTDDLADWNLKPGMFVDLNEPVPVPPTGTSTLPSYKFPIVDPRASVAGSAGELPVAGFTYQNTIVSGGQTTSVSGVVAATSRTDINARVPMPVRWMYVLRDGSLVTPVSGDKIKTAFTTSTDPPTVTDVPTVTNPIVGRIAFWTDDDSCKVNINTATEGSHWEMPIANTETDKEYAFGIPSQNEYSRYPGHPAATSLSPILQAAGAEFIVDETLPQKKVQKAHALIHQLSPRVAWGGTEAGAKIPPGTSALKEERLYASVDEMFFNKERNQNIGLDAGDLDLARFFLTAHSRAPELNLFGKPRINLWPVSLNTDANNRNAKDKLLAFLCETTGKGNREWCVQRFTNFSSPGSIAGAGSSQHPTLDYDKDEWPDDYNRNQSMYESYLRVLTGANNGGVFAIPGFTNTTFRSNTKFGPQRCDQMLAECMDLLRWGVNSYTTVADPGKEYYYLPRRGGSNPNNRGQSSAVPLEFYSLADPPDLTTPIAPAVSVPLPLGRGFGRWPTITEAAIVFMQVTPPDGDTDPHIQAFLVLEPFNPTCGPASMTPNIIYRVQGLDTFTITPTSPPPPIPPPIPPPAPTPTSLGFPAIADNLCQATDGSIGGAGSGSTPYAGFISQFANPNPPVVAKKASQTQIKDPGDNYPFISQPVKLKITDTDFTFSGGTLTIDTYPGWAGTVTGAPLLQRIKLTFPEITTKLKLPSTTAKMTVDERFADLHTLRDNLILQGDITRSVEASSTGPAKGDLRFFSARKSVPASWFATHLEYNKANFEQLHFLRHGAYTDGGQFGQYAAFPPSTFGAQGGRPNTNDTAGSLVKDLTYSKQCPPAVPRGLLSAENSNGRPGDWDNGTGIIEDGPYIRKPDEGNLEGGTDSAYLNRHLFNVETGKTFSPNRQICSAVAFGSLPTGIHPSSTTAAEFQPWQTLLFCPNPPSRSTNALDEPTATDHKGFQAPRDHLLLDLFWMPIVDPYAISEPLSTAGKINLNYQMAPFSHIERSTGIHAVLKSSRITAITPKSAGEVLPAAPIDGYNKIGNDVYKAANNTPTHSNELRYAVNAEATLDGFRNRFNQGDIFRSASEICEIFLVPKRLNGASYASDAKLPPLSGYAGMTDWWNGNVNSTDAFELTGDNTREAPYNHLYPRLTTKSNTYTVHYRVQTLRKARSTSPTEWVEGKDSVSGEFRGSTTLERYLDPNDKEMGPLMVGGGNTFKNSWDVLYRMRIIQRKQFVP